LWQRSRKRAQLTKIQRQKPISRALRRIALPQAMRVIIPPTGNLAIALLKDSSLVSVISMTELLDSVQLIYANTVGTRSMPRSAGQPSRGPA
jgi:ABC-type arginine/histidine transport system permease subunit